MKAKRPIRPEFNDDEHRRIRLAAAATDQTMTQFVREIVLAKADEVLANNGFTGPGPDK